MRICKRILLTVMAALLLLGCDLPQSAVSDPAQAPPIVEQTTSAPAAPAVQTQPTAPPAKPTAATEAPTAQPAAEQPSAGEQPATTVGILNDDGKLLFAPAADLGKLDSYRARHTWSYNWSQGENSSGTTDILVEYVREPYAERVVITRNGDASSQQEMIRHGDTTYMLTPEGWQALQSSAPLFPPEADPRLGMLPYVAGATADPVGEENVDGVTAMHYRYPQDQLTLGDYYTQTSEATADVWVSTEHDVYVRALLTWKGATSDMGEGGFSLESRVTDINQPINIEAPEGVSPPELPEDIAMMPDASEIALVEKAVYYQTHSAPSEVADYYKAKMPALGWTMQRDSRDERPKDQPIPKEPEPVSMRFINTKDGRIVNMSVQPGPTTLVVMAVIEPPTKAQ